MIFAAKIASLKICEEVGANSYINLPGGEELYDPESFFSHEIDLNFIDTSGIARYGYLQALALGDEQFSISLRKAVLRASSSKISLDQLNS